MITVFGFQPLPSFHRQSRMWIASYYTEKIKDNFMDKSSSGGQLKSQKTSNAPVPGRIYCIFIILK